MEEAIAEYREAIRLNKDFYPEGQACLGVCLRDKGQMKEALAAFQKSVEGYRVAFAAQPQMANNLQAHHRYNAACAAAGAAASQRKDADEFDTKGCAGLRQQALEWLRDDLRAWRQVLDKSSVKAGPTVEWVMKHWLQDPDFAGVRGPEALAKLPEVERKDWQKLWEEVETMRQRAAQQPKPAGSARP